MSMNLTPLAAGLPGFAQRPTLARSTDKDVIPANQQLVAPDAPNATAKGDAEGAETGDAGGTKQIVDIRTNDAGDVKTTVIAYSDGSTDKFSQVKPGSLAPSPAQQNKKSASFGEKGMTINLTA